MVSLEVAAILLSGISISASLFYYASVLRSQNETRQAQLFMPIYAKFHDKAFMEDFLKIVGTWEWNSYDDWFEKYGRSNLKEYSSLIALFDYMEGIGVLVKRGLIDISFIDDLISGLIIMLWDKMESIVVVYRERFNYPQFAEHFEYLYNRLKEYMAKHPEQVA